MRRFRIGNATVEEGEPGFQPALAVAYDGKLRPLCLCQEAGVVMPLTGGEHDPSCESHEPPYELSGLGSLIGSAIQLDPTTGLAALKLDFSLSKTGRRASPSAQGPDPDSVKSEAKRLTLRGLLHYLWHEAGLNKWTSHWATKRQWWNIQWHLMEAAKQMAVKGGPLSEMLFVPEQFRSTNKPAIEQRRAAAFASIQPQKSGPRKLMVLVGEVKEFLPVRSGQKIIVKHMPGFIIVVDDNAWRRVQARFENELALWGANDTSHLMAIATIGMNPAGLAIVEEIALMVVAENWVPFESVHEQRLVQALAKLRERSTKGLRYNLPADQPIVSALFSERKTAGALCRTAWRRRCL